LRSQLHKLLFLRLVKIYFLFVLSVVFGAFLIPYVTALPAYIISGDFDPDAIAFDLSEFLLYVSLLKVFYSDSWQLFETFKPLNGAYWFIAIIVQTYIFLALVSRLRYFYTIITIVAAISMVMQFSDTIRETVPYGLFIDRFYAVFFGIVTSHLIKHFSVSTTLSLCTILATPFAIGYTDILVDSELVIRLIWALWCGLLILALHNLDSLLKQSSFIQLFAFVGSFSFTIYLLHVPLFPFVNMIARNLADWEKPVFAPIVGFPLIIICCYLWHLLFEKYLFNYLFRSSARAPVPWSIRRTDSPKCDNE
jgi:peptidoglycan/LPS O-acetylase OafA/YrhL